MPTSQDGLFTYDFDSINENLLKACQFCVIAGGIILVLASLGISFSMCLDQSIRYIWAHRISHFTFILAWNISILVMALTYCAKPCSIPNTLENLPNPIILSAIVSLFFYLNKYLFKFAFDQDFSNGMADNLVKSGFFLVMGMRLIFISRKKPPFEYTLTGIAGSCQTIIHSPTTFTLSCRSQKISSQSKAIYQSLRACLSEQIIDQLISSICAALPYRDWYRQAFNSDPTNFHDKDYWVISFSNVRDFVPLVNSLILKIIIPKWQSESQWTDAGELILSNASSCNKLRAVFLTMRNLRDQNKI